MRNQPIFSIAMLSIFTIGAMDVFDAACCESIDTFFAKTLRKNSLPEIIGLLDAGIDPNGKTSDGKPYVSFVRSNWMLRTLYNRGLNPQLLSITVERFLSYTHRSEEHTSELSHFRLHLVCRLLLE